MQEMYVYDAANVGNGSLAAGWEGVGIHTAKSTNTTKTPSHQELCCCVFGLTPHSNATFASVLMLLLFPTAEWNIWFISFETLHWSLTSCSHWSWTAVVV